MRRTTSTYPERPRAGPASSPPKPRRCLRAVPAADVVPVPLAEAARAAAVEAGEAAAEAQATVTLGAALMRTGEPERGLGLLRAGRRLAERENDLVTVGWALNFLAAARMSWSPYEDALAASVALGLQFNLGKLTRLGYEQALRAGDLARAESLVWGRLPIETDPLDAMRFTAAAGLLAIERGDDALATRMLTRANTVHSHPWTARVAAMLAVAVASRAGPPRRGVVGAAGVRAEPAGRPAPGPSAPARRGGALGAARRGPGRRRRAIGLVGGAGGPVGTVGCATPLAPDRRRRAGRNPRPGRPGRPAGGGLAGRGGPRRPGPGTAPARPAGRARDHGERAVALLHRWPGWRRESAEALLHSLRAGGDLTAREIEVLGCLAAGMSNQQVARSLGISIRTVAVHVSNLLRKTGAASRTEAALWAVRHQLARGR